MFSFKLLQFDSDLFFVVEVDTKIDLSEGTSVDFLSKFEVIADC